MRRVQTVQGMPFAGRLRSWHDLWRDRRDRLLADPRFQRWAARFPLTRRIARREARALFDLCAGFVYSQVLLACVRLRLLELLAPAPLRAAAIAARLELDEDAAERLLDAGVSLRLLARRSDGRFGLGELGAALLGNPSVRMLIEHHALLYTDLIDPVALLRGTGRDTRLARYWPYARTDEPAGLVADDIAPYTGLMAASQSFIADEVLAAYAFERHHRVLDVGGGDGAFLAALAAHAPRAHLTLFDLPPVAHRARARFLAAGLSARAQAVGGDFLHDALPHGADLVTLVRVIHDHDDAQALALLTAVRRAVTPDGAVLIAEPLAGTRGIERTTDAYFGFYFLAMGRGRTRSVAALTTLLAAAGFRDVVQHPTRMPLYAGVLTARPSNTVC